MPLNAQQQAALDFCLTGSGSLNLIARAGTGKTHTLLAIASEIRGNAFLGAFNRAIADELQRRIPQRPGLEANTLHGAGLRAWRSFYRNTKVDGNKMRAIARKIWPMDRKAAVAAEMLIGFAKQSAFGLDMPYEDVDLWERLIDYYDIEEEIPATVKRKFFLEGCVWAYEQSLEQCIGKGNRGECALDFNDMLLAPLYYRIALKTMQWVLLDEAQDTNETRRRLCLAMIGGGRAGRLIAVGDPAQSIYGFSGATADAMGLIRKQLNSTELPLNVTYRCPRAVVELAQTWVPDFTAHPTAPNGVIRHISHKDFWLEKFDPITDVILCRFTRPLAGIAATLRERGVVCVVEGQSGKSLLALAGKWGEISLDAFRTLLDEFEEAKVKEWTLEDRLDKAAAVRDRCGTVRAFMRGMGMSMTPRDLARQIEMTFREEDRTGVLTLATVHRSKGREWVRVYLIGRNEYMPSGYARQDWEMEQERNLMYVAVTRTKKELVEVDVPETEPGKRKEREWWELD